jgi:SRSO17 transposase
MISTITNQGKVRWMIYPGKMNAAVFIVFLSRLIAGAAQKVFLIVDNLSVHEAAAVNDGLATRKEQIEVFYLLLLYRETDRAQVLGIQLLSVVLVHSRERAMERRYHTRLQELLDDAVVPPGLLRGALPRLEAFLEPFVQSLLSPQQRTNAQHYVQGLLSDLDSKDAESIAYLHDRERQGMQKFIGQVDWDYRPLLGELARQVGTQLGQPDAVLVFDPSAFAKKGTASVGVGRQWCGRLGKVDNCQVGVYLGYVSRCEHALVDVRLYLPREWARDRTRRQKAGVPKAVRFRTRHQLALEMLDERGPLLPHSWISGDDEMGRSSWFRQQLRSRGERYLLAVPSNTLVRDLSAPPPPYAGRGRRPRVPFRRVDPWAADQPAQAWQTVDVRDGEQGPLVVQAAWAPVQARTQGRPSDVSEVLVVFREQQGDGSWKHDYLLSNAVVTTPVAEFARVFKAEHRIEECLQRAKSAAGLADYQVRTWEGWHHHQTLALLATWFLTQETRRGKNTDPRADGAAGAEAIGWTVEPTVTAASADAHPTDPQSMLEAQRRSTLLSLAATQLLAASTA